MTRMSESTAATRPDSTPTWYALYAVCRCEGPRPAPLHLNGRDCCGRCRKPLAA